MAHEFNGNYTDENLNRIAFPIGGIGSGMFTLDGNGGFSHVSLRHEPEVFNSPLFFSAVNVRRGDFQAARILQGRTPDWKVMFPWDNPGSGNGAGKKLFGLPFFRQCSFDFEFPFANVCLSDDDLPIEVKITGWSPFAPGDSFNSSLPVGAVEYTITNTCDEKIELVFYHAAENFIAKQPEQASCGCDCKPPEPDHSIFQRENGFVLHQGADDHRCGSFYATCSEQANINCRWFRGGWFDSLSFLWSEIQQGKCPETQPVHADDPAGPSAGASLSTAFTLEAGQSRTIKMLFGWYVPQSNISAGLPPERSGEFYKPFYAGQFDSVDAVMKYWQDNFVQLREKSSAFARKLQGLEIPDEAKEAIGANLTILKSPTVMRQADGRLWAWEGCCDSRGCCHGSCTHVWNYAQAIAHLFPDLERSLRQTEFFDSQDERGHQNFRSSLPVGPVEHNNHAAADGQLGGIMKVFRDWKICGDDNWLRQIWPQVQKSLDYCIKTWDPDGRGVLFEPHHNTYDIEFWGPDGMCSSFYIGALKAASKIAEELGDNEKSQHYESLYIKGRSFIETELFNGEFFIQKTQWENLRSPSPEKTTALIGSNIYKSTEALELLKAEGPKYQYGDGCLSDGVLGAWMAEVCMLGEILDREKVKSHLLAVHKYNLKKTLHDHSNTQRSTYGLNEEGGLLLCTWPNYKKLTLPFPYSDEVWTGIEYQVASHLIMLGRPQEGLEIIRTARSRYDGRVRNPLNEYECGHWYARALSSYAILQAYGEKL